MIIYYPEYDVMNHFRSDHRPSAGIIEALPQ